MITGISLRRGSYYSISEARWVSFYEFQFQLIQLNFSKYYIGRCINGKESVSTYLSIYQSVVSDRCVFDSVHFLSPPLLLKNAVMLWLWSRVTPSSTSTISKERLLATVVIKGLGAGIYPLEDWLHKIRFSGMVLMTCLLRRVSMAGLLLCKLLLHGFLEY